MPNFPYFGAFSTSAWWQSLRSFGITTPLTPESGFIVSDQGPLEQTIVSCDPVVANEGLTHRLQQRSATISLPAHRSRSLQRITTSEEKERRRRKTAFVQFKRPLLIKSATMMTVTTETNHPIDDDADDAGEGGKRTMFKINYNELKTKILKLESNLNEAYIQYRDRMSFYSQQKESFLSKFEQIKLLIQVILPQLDAIYQKWKLTSIDDIAEEDQDINYNGYFALLDIYSMALDKIYFMIADLKSRRLGMMLNINTLPSLKLIESWVNLLTCLNNMILFCVQFIIPNDDQSGSNLFVDTGQFTKEEFDCFRSLLQSKNVYGRTLGFQYDDSLGLSLTTLVVALVTVADNLDIWDKGLAQRATRLLYSSKYMLNPELRSSKMADVMHNGGLSFWKAFWNVGNAQIFKVGTAMKYSDVKVSVDFEIKQIHDGGSGGRTGVELRKPIKIRLVSNKVLPHMEDLPCNPPILSDQATQSTPMSDLLLFHAHGGGFIAMSPESCEVYLRPWTTRLNAPIISVDYTLAPEAAYPQPLNECFLAYKWALANANKLGWTGKKIMIIGDSAGGNLAMATSLKAALKGTRVPDAICLFYPVLSMKLSISPSRIVSMIDVLLNGEAMMWISAAYTGICASNADIDETFNHPALSKPMHAGGTGICVDSDGKLNMEELLNQFNRKKSLLSDPLLSPIMADAELLKKLPHHIHFWACGSDPLLDDSIVMTKNLRKVNIRTKLKVFPKLSHGFLNMHLSAKASRDAFNTSLDDLVQISDKLRVEATKMD